MRELVLVIQSALLDIRKTEVNDLSFVLATETDLDNTPFIGQWTFEQHHETLTNADVAHLIIENKQGDIVGYAILTGLLDPNKAVCVKRIANKIKGQGYGKEAMKLIVTWIFENTDTHRVWLDVKDFNHRARYVYESVGFIFEGTLRDSYFNGVKFESLSVMSMLRREYKREELS
ncbi:GNAT family N-acetyltransferase [Paenibacillus radicis (ex Xue et al. 2023)]|uniref:GNAT family N-acetyltransferase n=1 Tax=Paenibacillus radicis (ex Xue et al. 2023) TaxID=2972489 RepID=A0ABT1YG89_9BACL|nr:GNAT family protein [Paenibacillus radicis (ex Xue et al. 2023)]MCR8632213.1 GNAT family N-acetyltransferase [Paenibacillus radicis (ex Xue et al. 2023)]